MTVPQARAAVPSVLVRGRDILISEWTKLRSVRSNRWTLLSVAIVTVGSAALVGSVFAAGPPPPPGSPVTALTQSFLGYAEYAVLPVGVLGILAFSSEYATGLIRTTYAAVPRRWAVLAAKAAVVGAAALIAGEVLAFTSFLLTQAILSGHHRGLSLSHPGVTGAVLAAGILLGVSAVTGLGLGAIVRHVAGAVAALVGLIYLLSLACLLLPSPWADRIGRFTIALAAYQVVALQPQRGLLSPGLSMLVLLAWPAVVLLAAGVVISRAGRVIAAVPAAGLAAVPPGNHRPATAWRHRGLSAYGTGLLAIISYITGPLRILLAGNSVPSLPKSQVSIIVPHDDRFRRNSTADPAVALPKPLQTPVAGLIVTGGQEMPETQPRRSPSEGLPYWAALTGGPGQLAWSAYSDGHLVVIALDGELDLATRPGLAERLDPLAEAGRHLILDLGALTFCDCTGLNLFLRWQRQTAAAGGELQIVAATPRFRRLAGMAGARSLIQAGARRCQHHCCLDSHPELRAEPI